MKTFTRQATIRLKYNFEDSEGVVFNPNNAQVTISYLQLNTYNPQALIVPLLHATGTNDWYYEWDSSVAAPGVVSTHAETMDGQPVASIDGEFRLKANRANRQERGDYIYDPDYVR